MIRDREVVTSCWALGLTYLPPGCMGGLCYYYYYYYYLPPRDCPLPYPLGAPRSYPLGAAES